jgi:hypothetical protein
MPGVSRVGTALAVRYEVGTVSAHMRDDSVDSVTPGGHPAPLGARGARGAQGAFLGHAWLWASLVALRLRR